MAKNTKTHLNKIRLLSKRFILLASFLCSLSPAAWAMEPTVSPTEVQTIPGRVLVRVKEGTPVEQVQEIAQAVGAEVDRVLAPWGLYLFRFHESVPVQEVVQQLQSYAAVRSAKPDVRYLASGHLETTSTARVLEGPLTPIVVAVLDTGMDLRHETFAGRLTVNTEGPESSRT